MDKYYLIGIKPKYNIVLYITLVFIILIFISLCYFKTYDIYNYRGFIYCNDKCYVKLIIDIQEINKVDNIDYIKINNNKYIIDNINISEIVSDEISKINYHIVEYELNSLNERLNTFQDVKVYSNEEYIINKIINNFFRR